MAAIQGKTKLAHRSVVSAISSPGSFAISCPTHSAFERRSSASFSSLGWTLYGFLVRSQIWMCEIRLARPRGSSVRTRVAWGVSSQHVFRRMCCPRGPVADIFVRRAILSGHNARTGVPSEPRKVAHCSLAFFMNIIRVRFVEKVVLEAVTDWSLLLKVNVRGFFKRLVALPVSSFPNF